MATGEVEVRATEIEVLGPTEPLPFNVFPETAVPEDLRLTYRFLDLRRDDVEHLVLSGPDGASVIEANIPAGSVTQFPVSRTAS